MLKGFKDFFYLNRGEQRAVLILFAVIILVYGILIFTDQKPAVVDVDTTGFNKEVRAFLKDADQNRVSENQGGYIKDYSAQSTNLYRQGGYPSGYKKEINKPLTPFIFDPNTITEVDLMKLGLPDRLVKTILNYRSKGGRFYDKEDLRKIYGLREEQYRVLEPYVNIPSRIRTGFVTSKTSPVKVPVHIVNLNSADSAELDGLRGIGPAFALRIIRYRDLLGGFCPPGTTA